MYTYGKVELIQKIHKKKMINDMTSQNKDVNEATTTKWITIEIRKGKTNLHCEIQASLQI